MTPPDKLMPETLRGFADLTESKTLARYATAWAADLENLCIVRKTVKAQRDVVISQEARIEALEEDYHELIYAVATKCEGETRHQTALRYIIEREAHGMGDGQAALRGEEER
jgi:hypothetical protein